VDDHSYIAAHGHSSNNRDTLVKSDWCGCFYCCSSFSPSEIDEWVDDETTAICPICGVDSVIGNASGFPIEKEFLGKMHDHWF
jgi:hypothetical protein